MHNIWNVTSHNIGRTHTVHTKHCTKLPIENWSGSIHCLLHTFHCSVQSVRSDKGRSTLTYHWTRGSTLHPQCEIRPLYTLVSLCILVYTRVYSCIPWKRPAAHLVKRTRTNHAQLVCICAQRRRNVNDQCECELRPVHSMPRFEDQPLTAKLCVQL